MTKQELGNTVIYPVKGSFKPIISKDVFNKVQDLLDNRSLIIEEGNASNAQNKN